MEKKKTSEAHMRAIAKYQEKAYFKTLVRFPKDREADIRKAAGDSLNGFIVRVVMEAVEKELNKTETAN